MSWSGSPAGLIVVALSIFAAVMAADSGAFAVANRELLVLGLLATAWVAIQAALAWRAGRAQATPVIFVREGAVRRSSGQFLGGDRLRTVSLAVESGQAVVLERSGLFSRVLSPGLSVLLPGETVYKVVATQPRTLSGNVACVTRDGITVTVDFEVSAQIMPRAGDGSARESFVNGAPRATVAQRASEDPLWSEDALVRAAYETHSWESAVLGLSRSSLRDQFARSYLADIELPAVSPQGTISLESFQLRCHRRISAASRPLGISIQRFRIANLGIPSELAGGSLLDGRARRAGVKLHRAQSEDTESSSLRRTAIRLAGVLGGGPFLSFRQAMRSRTGNVIIPSVLLEGHRWLGRALGQADPIPFDLLPDRLHYDIQIHGHKFQAAGLYNDEHLLFATLPEPVDGDIVALVVDGQIELRRYCQMTDHILLEPERESQPALALASSDDLAASLRARYSGSAPPIEVRPAVTVKILGRAAIAFQPQPESGGRTAERSPRKVDARRDPEPRDMPAAPAGETETADAAG
jgi:regulator of protease activity HflC (stomatin/prohibitin superfamily)